MHLHKKSIESHIKPVLRGRLVKLRRADCNELVAILFRKGLSRKHH